MSDATKVEAFLDRERAAIRDGKFEELQNLLEAKEALLARLSESEIDAPSLARLKQKSARNAALLEAARRGLGAALTQVGQAQTAATPRTYGPKGERDSLGPNAKRVEKRC